MNDQESKVLQKLRKDLEQEGFHLAPGWRVAIETRKSGSTKGGTDKYYFTPCERKLRSRMEVMRFLGENAQQRNKRARVATDAPALCKNSEHVCEKERRTVNFRATEMTARKKDSKKIQKSKPAPMTAQHNFSNEVEQRQRPRKEEQNERFSIVGIEDDEEEEDEDEFGVQQQQSQDSEQFTELKAFVHGLLERPAKVENDDEDGDDANENNNERDNENNVEEKMLSEYFEMTGFEPKYRDLIELKSMVDRERRNKQQGVGGYYGSVDTSNGRSLPTSGELALQRALVFESAEAKFSNALAVENRSDMNKQWRGTERVPKYLGNTTFNSTINNGSSPATYAPSTHRSNAPRDITNQYHQKNHQQQQQQHDVNDTSFLMSRVTGSRLHEQNKNSQALVVASKAFNPLDQFTVNEVFRALSLQNEEAKMFISQRDDELRQITTIVESCLRDQRSGSIYVGGLPGTGKSLTLGAVEKIVKKWSSGGNQKSRPKVCSINCMAIQGKPTSVFRRICEQLNIVPTEQDKIRGQAECSDMYEVCAEIAALRRFLSGGKATGETDRYCQNDHEEENDNRRDHRLELMNSSSGRSMIIILLDEMDQLEYRDAAILYELFALPSLPNSRCILVGVSNAMNLTDKALPRLRARGCEPALVAFTAYTSVQLKQLLLERVVKFDAFEQNALELCARKVSSQTGDMRKALRVCTDAAQLCVEEARNRYESIQREGCVISDNGEIIEGESALANLPPIRKVKVSHMARAISKMFQNPVVETIRALPQQQQMILCACVRTFGKRTDFNKTAKEITLNELLRQYTLLCKEARIREMVPSDFSTACDRLADARLLLIKVGREEYARRVSMLVQRDDVLFSLQGIQFYVNLVGCDNSIGDK